MQGLNTSNGSFTIKVESLANRITTRHGCSVIDAMLLGTVTNGRGIGNRLTTFSGINNQVYFVALNHIDNMRTTLFYLVDYGYGQASLLNQLCCPCGSDQFKAKI